MKGRVTFTSLACMALALASASARAEPVKLLPGPFELPDRIGPMRFDGKPRKYDDPRLGASYQYLGGGLSLTVYVYDLGAENIPDGGDTRLVCEAFEGAKGDVLHAGYQDVVVKTEQLARLDAAAEAPVAREAVFEFMRDNRPTVSYLWVTGASKEFVKLRFSVDEKYRDELGEARRTVLDALGEALKPHLHEASPDTKEGGVGEREFRQRRGRHERGARIPDFTHGERRGPSGEPAGVRRRRSCRTTRVSSLHSRAS